MKLESPQLFKGIFKQYLDERGYLNPIDITAVANSINVKSFALKYQLTSFSLHKHCFRGLHYQLPPHAQSKLVIVHSGKILDIVVPFDNPKESKIKKYELEAGDILFVPNTYAHGFLTKTPNVSIQYLLDHEFNHESYNGINAIDYIKQFTLEYDISVSDKDLDFVDHIILDIIKST